ncbi:hypothetical protein C2I36_15325 [Rhodobacteraceae bacterium WD3A24]|nr:hypothetical protein C2I36_15325 [Rhodobacteraceae bacterium WD3A24]
MLGTISISEFRQALLTDLAALQDEFGIEYLRAPRLTVPITNEYGDPIAFSALTDRHRTRIDTHHYRPACKDYDL